VMSARNGDDVRLAREESGLLPTPPATWFNLTNVFADRGNVLGEQGIDRLSIGYSTPDFVMRVGRQALSWGGGLVFRPMDLFDPFAPNATDTEYKPGTDMLYLQWLFPDGSDLQTIAVPRPAVAGAEPALNASSFALHFHTTIDNLQTNWLVATDHGDWTTAVEMSGPLGGATWDIEMVPTVLRAGPTRVSALANISDATSVLARNATIFAEYFHNGFGTTDSTATVATLPSELTNRLARGQLFSLRQDYLAAGMTLEWTPLLTLSPTLIANLNDGSFYLLSSATYSVADNLALIGGVQLPIGPRGSEFGGLHSAPSDGSTVGPSPQLYIQVRQYF